MSTDLFIPLLGFVLVAALTPGPNNLLLATVGMRFGVRAAVPQLFGIHAGVYTLLVLCALGINQIIVREPRILLVLKVFGSVYLIYLAWQILGVRLNEAEQESQQPPTFIQSFAFQFSNPKAWMMATTGIGLVLPFFSSTVDALLALFLSFAIVGTLCNLTWIWMGTSLKTAYQQTTYRTWINSGFAVLTVATAIWFWLG